jgi:hypothetical protein
MATKKKLAGALQEPVTARLALTARPATAAISLIADLAGRRRTRRLP